MTVSVHSFSVLVESPLSVLLVWTLKLCHHNSLPSLLISHRTVPRILLYSPSMFSTHILFNLLRKPCIPHNLQTKIAFKWPSVTVPLFSIFCVTRNASCYRYLDAPSSGWISATFKSSDLEPAALASLGSTELSISYNGSPIVFNVSSQATVSQPSQASQHSRALQHSVSSRPSVKDDDNKGDSPPAVGVTQEIALAVEVFSSGLTTAFYLHFWNSLGALLPRVADPCFFDGELVESMKESITLLIFKKRRDVRHLKNWPPISLLNVDFKIISKAIRLFKVIKSIVHSNKSCPVPCRTIL